MRRTQAAKDWIKRAAPAACLLLGACGFLGGPFQAPPQARGNRIEADQLEQLVVGTTTRADVSALVGSPTAQAPFDDNTWLYISSTTQNRVGRVPAVLDQSVVALSFDDAGVLRGIERKTADDSLPVEVVTRTTPSPGTEASFLQQLLGNVGKFNALGSGAAATGPSGGAPRPY